MKLRCYFLFCLSVFGLNGVGVELGQGTFRAVQDTAKFGFDPAKLNAIHKLQKKFIADEVCLSNVALLASDGKVVYHRAATSKYPGDRPITEKTVFPIWSMSKPITSVAAMILHERGAFKLDDPVSRIIPQLAKLRVKAGGGKTESLKNQITYRDLLRHSSGIDGYDGSFDQQGTWKEVMELDSLTELIDLLEVKPIEHQPGKKHTYGLSTAVMGRAIEILSGQSFDKFLEKEIFKPLGMKHTRFYLTEKDRGRFQPLFVKLKGKFRPGTPAEDELYYAPKSSLFLGGEGLVSTLEDYGRFCQMLVDRGVAPNGKQIILPKTLDLMLSDQLKGIPGYGDARKGYAFGLGFYFLEDTKKEGQNSPNGIFGWGGYHTTHFWIDPKNKLYAVFMARLYPYNGKIQTEFRKAVYEALK